MKPKNSERNNPNNSANRTVSKEELHANMQRGLRMVFVEKPTDLDEMLRKSLDIVDLKNFKDSIILNNLREKMNWNNYEEDISCTKVELRFGGGDYKGGYLFSKDGEHFAPGTYYYVKEDGNIGIKINYLNEINTKYPPGDDESWFHSVRRTIIMIETLLELER